MVAAAPSLAEAYAHCENIARAHYENFPVASKLLPARMRPHIAAIYAFARAADDFADEPGLDDAERLRRLDDWQRRLHAPPGSDPVFLALAQTAKEHRLPASLFEDLLSAFRQDVTTKRYERWADVLDYCRRSANPVGRLVLRVAGYDDPRLDRASDALCTALQLTNFWQDLERDWAIGRVYVPRRWLAEAGIAPDRLTAPEHREQLARIASRLVACADPYYASARAGLAALPLRSAWSVATARDVYRAIGRKVREKGSHAWDARVSTSALDKLWYVARGAAVALATRGLPVDDRPPDLWQRPH